MTPQARLQVIVQVIRDRGSYAMGPADAAALEAVLAGHPDPPPQPPEDAALAALVAALSVAGWVLYRR